MWRASSGEAATSPIPSACSFRTSLSSCSRGLPQGSFVHMPTPFDHSTTPWQAGSFRRGTPQLLFGSMYEDPLIEIDSFAPGSRVFCIASAGCTALALSAAGHDVTAVDINPEQVQYAQAPAAGAALRQRADERMVSRGRSLLPAPRVTARPP